MTIKGNGKTVLFLFLAFLIFYSLPSKAQAQTIIAPTITSISAIDASTTIIKGVATVDTDVMLFLDNKFIGSAITNSAGTSPTSADFSYVYKKDLVDGQHILTAIAHDSQTQIISDYSRPFIFIVSEKKEISVGTQTNNTATANLPSAPVLQDPPAIDSNGRLVVTGWARNNLKINIFLDEKPLTSFLVNNNETGTANFGYVLRQSLTNGGHLIYVTATDNSDKESVRSNYLYYLAGSTNNEQSLNGNQNIAGQNNQTKTTKVSEDNKTNNNTDQELSNILEQKQATDKNKSGMVNESKEMQGKLKWNLIIFILFLIAVIAWIFWVNRELIKEKREQNKKIEAENKQDKLV